MEVGKTDVKTYETTIWDLLHYVYKQKWLILILLIISSVSAYLYSASKYVPLYRATASMVVNTRQTIYFDSSKYVTQNASDIYLAQKLVDTYSIILKSNKVMEYVINDLSLNLPAEALKGLIDLFPQKDTQVVFVSVTCSDPLLAVSIANSLMKVAPKAMMETLEIGSVNVLDEAKYPTSSIPFDPKRPTLISLIIAFVLGVSISVLIGILYPRVISTSDIEEKLELRTLGEIPHIRKKNKKSFLSILSENINITFIEAFSMLRIVFRFLLSNYDVQTIVVTSASENEGKSTVAANASISMALSGKSVLLIDADLRKPSLHKCFGLVSDETDNILSILTGEASIESCIVNVCENLYFIPGAVSEENPNNLLASYNLKSMLDELKNSYDYIIIDTPPASVVSDAATISGSADGVVVVIKQDYSSLQCVSQIVNDFINTGANVLGCVLNDIKHRSIKYYKDCGYRYEYGKKENDGEVKGNNDENEDI